jgi:protein-S-isoprenylcysteine O-methyltransferase Ste14
MRITEGFDSDSSIGMKIFLLGALVIYGVARVIETFRKRNKIHGRVIAPYTLHLLVVAHATVFAVTFYDGMGKEIVTPFVANTLLGFLLVTIATIGRFYSVKALGAYHSIQIEVRKNHPIITQGLYRFLRNPYYVSNAIEVVGFPLIVNSAIGSALAILLYWPCLYLRILLEERALLDAAKAPFSEYMRRVPRLLPMPFRLGAFL